ncbi:MAG: hypothetical protein OXD29_08155 [Roseovarius sp.]|nr:hypothetical protein [Roseovarius sp.]
MVDWRRLRRPPRMASYDGRRGQGRILSRPREPERASPGPERRTCRPDFAVRSTNGDSAPGAAAPSGTSRGGFAAPGRPKRPAWRSKHVARMVAVVPAVALETLHVPGLQSLERLVFNGPMAAGAARDRPHRAPVKPQVGDPGERCRLAPRFNELGHVRLEIEVLVVGRPPAVPI